MYTENNFAILQGINGIKMNDLEFKKLSNFINEGYGIKLPISKKIMVQSRLLKRLRELNIQSFADYFDLVFAQKNTQEMIHMIDAITTNKTDFFREHIHFNFMHEVVLPEYVKSGKANKTLKVWSAGCSTGEEPYSIAMSISEFSEMRKPIEYRILATDLSTEVLLKAKEAIYAPKRAEDIPDGLKSRFLNKIPNSKDNSLQMIQAIRNRVEFRRLNFLNKHYPVQGEFDVIFCRNVLIYFERDVQEMVISNLCKFIPSGGYFFLGHSESILGMNVPLEQIKPTIFRKK
jgi:chemotaxis protein methyltransferase CheR